MYVSGGSHKRRTSANRYGRCRMKDRRGGGGCNPTASRRLVVRPEDAAAVHGRLTSSHIGRATPVSPTAPIV
jgi:hypothetical protein